jgi:hypothetical protein
MRSGATTLRSGATGSGGRDRDACEGGRSRETGDGGDADCGVEAVEGEKPPPTTTTAPTAPAVARAASTRRGPRAAEGIVGRMSSAFLLW